MNDTTLVFNPPPGWPKPPEGWTPPKDWTPNPDWPPPPPGWQLWVPAENGDTAYDDSSAAAEPIVDSRVTGELNSGLDASSDDMAVSQRIALLEAENAALRSQLETMGEDADAVVSLDDERVLQEVGIYQYHHPLENAVAYQDRLQELKGRIAELVKAGGAIESSNMFTFDNSLAKGRKMTRDLSKLMLRAYNAEADNSIRTLRAGNVMTAKRRLSASRTAIAKLGRMMEMRISDTFHELRIEEIELTSDYLMMKQEEKEAAREERARLREERKVERELAAERERLNKERSHLLNAIEALKAQGNTDPELERKLDEIDLAITQNEDRAANVRAGYVYVISNRGAFGKGIVKIGLTRRLEPQDCVTELSGASVPFRFDVHALFFSEDAVALEADLHEHFADRRVNHANARKEFFFANPSEVRDALAARVGSLLEFAEQVEATEYLQSVRYWPDEFIKGSS